MDSRDGCDCDAVVKDLQRCRELCLAASRRFPNSVLLERVVEKSELGERVEILAAVEDVQLACEAMLSRVENLRR